MHYVFFLGSHPVLSAAEVFRVLQRQHFAFSLVTGSDDVLIVHIAENLPDTFLSRIGGTSRIGIVLSQQKRPYTADEVMRHLPPLPQHKITIGFSCFDIPIEYLKKIATALKRLLHAHGTPMRFIIPRGQSRQLNAAQVRFNNLHRNPHHELTFLHHNDTHYLVRTAQVQDIQSYELRDTLRPVRRMNVGMLPPKIAQLMLNLVPYIADSPVLYDPFCGSGTVLQEGWLAGYTLLGSDSSKQMLEATQQNLLWLQRHFTLDSTRKPPVWLHDVRQPFPEHLHHHIDAIVTEPYLGKPPHRPLSPTATERSLRTLGELYLHFFHTARAVLTAHGFVLFLLPAFRRSYWESHYSLFPDAFLDEISKLGYRREQLLPQELSQWYEHSERTTTLYARPDALVGREFTLWQKL